MGPNSGIVRRETLPQTEETLATYNPFQDVLQRNGFAILIYLLAYVCVFAWACMHVCVCVCARMCVMYKSGCVRVCVCACMRVMHTAGCVPTTSQHQVKPV